MVKLKAYACSLNTAGFQDVSSALELFAGFSFCDSSSCMGASVSPKLMENGFRSEFDFLADEVYPWRTDTHSPSI
jgi:hypothetical protein